MPPRVPDYVITEDYSFTFDRTDTKTLPAGSFVKPIELVYVPKHVVEQDRWRGFNKAKDVFCYTRLGIVSIPRKIIREA